MSATRASGTNAVRYGTMRENVLSLEVVLADGRVIRTARRARKSSAGYDLTRLFVGSEGTLGIITKITVRLHGIPEAISAAVCSFDDISGAVDTTILTIQSGIPIARIELLDDVQMGAINAYCKVDYPVKDTLFLEFHGTEASVREQAERVQELASENGGSNFQWSSKTEERSAMWKARHEAAYSMVALRPGAVCDCHRRLCANFAIGPVQFARPRKILAMSRHHCASGRSCGRTATFIWAYLIDLDDPEEVALGKELK